MAQRENSPLPMSALHRAAGSAANPSYAVAAHDEKVLPPAFPGDLADAPIPGWDNAWIDLGGEG
jgi:hypothetical protein